MDAVEFLKEKARMTQSDSYAVCGIPCYSCPLGKKHNGESIDCDMFEILYPEKAVEIVEAWSKKYPRKTYLEDFKSKFPNLMLTDYGIKNRLTVGDLYNGIEKNWDDVYIEHD